MDTPLQPPPPQASEPSEPRDLRESTSLGGGVMSPLVKGRILAYVEESGIEKLALVGLFVLSVFYTLYFAREFFLPVLLALLLSVVLRPLVRRLRRIGLPEWIGAALVVLALVAAVAFAVWRLSGPAAEWLDQGPSAFIRLEEKFRAIRESIEQAQRATQEIENIATPDSDAPEVVVRGPGLGAQIFSQAQTLAINALVMFVLVFFLLSQGPSMVARLLWSLADHERRRRLWRLGREAQSQIAAYLRTVTLINAGLGVVTGLAMWAAGMPNPALWGAMAGILNFVPYVGAAVTLIVIGLVAALTFDAVAAILAPPLIFFALTSLEGQVVTPLILGRRLTLNPIAIFVGVIFWGWIWGVPGALLATPLLAAFKIVCDHTDSLKPLGAILGGSPRRKHPDPDADPESEPEAETGR